MSKHIFFGSIPIIITHSLRLGAVSPILSLNKPTRSINPFYRASLHSPASLLRVLNSSVQVVRFFSDSFSSLMRRFFCSSLRSTTYFWILEITLFLSIGAYFLWRLLSLIPPFCDNREGGLKPFLFFPGLRNDLLDRFESS